MRSPIVYSQAIHSLLAGFVTVLSLSGLLFSGVVQADSLVVQPLQLKLAATKPVADLLLRNDATEERTINIGVNAWQQVGGIDQLVPSNKLIVHPAMVRLQPGESAKVRVGLKMSGPLWEEQAFQVQLTEISPVPDRGSATVYSSASRMSGRTNVPVFLLPPGAANPRIAWDVSRGPEGTVTLKASNSGRGHVQLHSAILSGPDGQRIEMHDISTVILPGGSRSWKLKDEASGGLWQLTADTNAGPMQAELELEPSHLTSARLTLAQ